MIHDHDHNHNHNHNHTHGIMDSYYPVDLHEAETYDCISMNTPGNSAVGSPVQIAMSQLNNTAVPILHLAATHQIAEIAMEGRDRQCAL